MPFLDSWQGACPVGIAGELGCVIKPKQSVRGLQYNDACCHNLTQLYEKPYSYIYRRFLVFVNFGGNRKIDADAPN